MALKELVKYRLLEEVGHGGMAVVYRGIDTALNREVAVKILHAHLAEQEESKQRFQREAQAVAKLRHDNIIEIYDYSGIASAESYIVTEFIHGYTLKEFLSRHPISHPEVAAMIVVEICNALGHAHSLGIIHRDIKPENIMIREDGRVKLTDFGIAQVVDVQRLTITGQLLGSPAYMAPELVEGKQLDFRTDIFSAGTLLYQLATSELPFKGKNPHEVLKRIAEGRYLDPEVANPVVGSHLARIIRKALAHDPQDRYADINELKTALLEFLAVVELTDPRTELSAYFADPVSYAQQLQQRVVQGLTARGKQALQQRHVLAALEHFNRVLCADPANAEVLTILEQITRRRRLGRVSAVLALIAAFSSAAYLISSFWPRGAAPRGAAVSRDLRLESDMRLIALAAAPVDARPVREDAPGVRRSSVPDVTAAVPPLDMRVGPVVRHAPIRRRIEIVPTPKAVTIWINDRRLGDYGPELRHVELPMGQPATLVFRNDACCFERVLVIGPRQSPEVLRVRLPWKPARVSVQVTPAVPADVLVGNLVVHPGQAVEVPIPSYADDGRDVVEVKVSAPGYFTETLKVEVRANTPASVRIPLRRAP